MHTPSPLPRGSGYRLFRIALIVASVVAAIVGSVVLAMRNSGEKVTTRGVIATLPVPGHPGSVVAGPDALWVAMNGDPQGPVGNRPLVRIDLATGAVVHTVNLGGQASHLARVGDRLLASVQPVGSDGFGPTRLAVLDWRSGIELFRRQFEVPLDQVVSRGSELWALAARPGTLLRLDPLTLAPASAPLALASGRTLGLASGAGYLWVTASDAGEVVRIDPATSAISHVHVGGFPVGIVVTGGSVWFADRERGNVARLDPQTLKPIGDHIDVGIKPSWLAVAANTLFVTDQDDGTVAQIDARSGKTVGPPIRIAPPSKGAPAPAVTRSGQSVWVSSFSSNTLIRINSAAAATAASLAAPLAGGGKVTVRITGANDGGDLVTDGGVVGTGHFIAAGAITDKGTVTTYRTVKDPLITLRHVTVGKKGTITFVIKIDMTLGTSGWTITSGTKAYKGLHGNGTERENADYTISTLTGTMSR